MPITRVYQFGLLPPTEHADVVRAQLRAAHQYRNDLVAIERGRRSAVRPTHDTDGVRDAIERLHAAPRTGRTAALRDLGRERRYAEAIAASADAVAYAREACGWPDAHRYDLSAFDAAGTEMPRIDGLDRSIRRDARALTTTYWGTYLTIEAAADQSRKSPLYDTDGITPNDPRFVRWQGEGQVGVQLQKGLATPNAMDGSDTRVRLIVERSHTVGGGNGGAKKQISEGTLWLRVGSDGREPIWAKWPIRLHRAIPDSAKWLWVRVSCRREGVRDCWTVEITLESPGTAPRARDTSLVGAVAIDLLWTARDDGSMHVGKWLDTDGQCGDIVLPSRIVTGIHKPEGIRSVRDKLRNELLPRLARLLSESTDALPTWLREAAATMPLWKSPERLHRLAHRWRDTRCDAARDAYDLLDAWCQRDSHLWAYEAGARREALRERREVYRVLAAQWSRQYRAVMLPDRDLSREARWGEESDRRFASAPQELRGALRHAFGADAHEWSGTLNEAIERWRDVEISASARGGEMDNNSGEIRGGAWARRKGRKRGDGQQNDSARNVTATCAE